MSTRGLAIGLLVGIGVGAIAVSIWSLTHAGIGWDSRYDVLASYAVRSVDPYWTPLTAYASVPGTSEFYGIFMQQFADTLHLIATGSSERLAADDPATYLYQGTANILLAVLSITALALAVGVALRSALAGAFLWAVILSTPLWLGMSSVDFKDIPIAAGLTLITSGVIFSFCLPRSRAILVGVLLAGSGGAVTLATRAGALPLIVTLGLGSAIGVFVLGRRGRASALPTEIVAAAAPVAAIVFTWATNPIARIDMPAWLEDATSVARSFPWNGTIRTAGHDLRSTDLPWWYVPAWLGAQLPLLTLVAVAGSLIVVVFMLVRQSSPQRLRTAMVLVPLTIQALALPVLTVASGAVLYDGIRHLLYAIPALIAIAAVALAALEQRSVRPGRRTMALSAAAVAVAAFSLFASIRWAPYSYAFVNPVAGRNAETRPWELDYWGVSAREGIRRLEALGLTPVHVEPTDLTGIPWGAARGPIRPGTSGGLYVFLRANRAADFGCTVVFTIKRDGQLLGEGARCPDRP